MRLANVAIEQDRVVVRRVVGVDVGTSVGFAAECVARPASAGRGTAGVQVVAAYQQVASDGSRISGGEQNIARQLALDVHVILVNPARLEIERLVSERPLVGSRCLRRGKWVKASGKTKAQLRRLSERGGAVGRGKSAARRKGSRELIGLAKVRRILP